MLTLGASRFLLEEKGCRAMTSPAEQSPPAHPLPHTLPALLELQARPQWVCWRKEQRGDRYTKVPYNPRTGKGAASDGPATWSSYEQAFMALGMGLYHGLGFMFNQDYTGID